jgi:hypothetical protein
VGCKPTHLSASRQVHGDPADKLVCIHRIRRFHEKYNHLRWGQLPLRGSGIRTRTNGVERLRLSRAAVQLARDSTMYIQIMDLRFNYEDGE